MPIFELAINQSNAGGHQNFLDTRAAFVSVLGKEEATLNEGKWAPFFTTDDTDLSRILAGMTVWSSMDGFGEAAARLLPQKEGLDYFASFDPLVYVLLETLDGEAFDIESIKKEGQVIEFAVRRGLSDDAFGAARDTFFTSLDAYKGYQFAREFSVSKLNEAGIPSRAENTQAVIIVWESLDDFQAAAQPIFASQSYADFAKNLEVEAYFATQPTK